jgi:hypothetical protein
MKTEKKHRILCHGDRKQDRVCQVPNFFITTMNVGYAAKGTSGKMI